MRCQQIAKGRGFVADGPNLSSDGVYQSFYGRLHRFGGPGVLSFGVTITPSANPLSTRSSVIRAVNAGGKGKSFTDAPFDFLPHRWIKHVVLKNAKDEVTVSLPHYEPVSNCRSTRTSISPGWTIT